MSWLRDHCDNEWTNNQSNFLTIPKLLIVLNPLVYCHFVRAVREAGIRINHLFLNLRSLKLFLYLFVLKLKLLESGPYGVLSSKR